MKLGVLLLLVPTGCVLPPEIERPPERDQQHLVLGLGLREMHSETFAEAQEQSAFLLEYDRRPESWPLWWVASLGIGADTTNDKLTERDGVTTELALGLRKYVDGPAGAHVYGTLGTAWIYGRIDEFRTDVSPPQTTSDRDASFGGYASVGVLWQFGRFVWGLDLRAVRASGRGKWFEDTGSFAHDEVTLFLGLAW